ncbi:hypothetical protein B9Z55_012320 [Caenorhabditis nigoni]|uniref:F-box domain-containing protein n=1 Tax=Caenorhabditis nigoni TaxID=1611254 RepID=A0A2G5TWP2_9PELO|nr:hypothetical protein B9Z55_012320 [Caenorhabditis nigoni]
MIFYEDDVFRQLTALIQTIFPETSKPKQQFPLLKLPRVVLLECIENLDVLEIIKFSLLSKRAKSIAKLLRWYPLHIRLVSGQINQICLRISGDWEREWIIEYPNDKESWKYPEDRYLFLKNNGNAIEDMKKTAEHICEVFRSPICDMETAEQSLIDWIIKFQPTIRNVWIGKDVSVQTLNHILKNLKVTNYLELQPISIHEKFEIMEPIPSRFLLVFNSYWVTLPSILNGTNSMICLSDSKLTPMDINTILKEWQLGSKLRNLEYLEIRTSTLLDLHSFSDEVYKNLNLTNGDEIDGRPTEVKIDDEYTYSLPEVQNVRNLIRNDGMIGSIFEIFEFLDGENMKTCFSFVVWHKEA